MLILFRSHKFYFLGVFVIFRASYNGGLGYLLSQQSKSRWLVQLCQNSGFFDPEGKHKQWYNLLKQECSKRMGDDYDFDKVPIEFNTWLVFRWLVDFILVNDFFAYCIFATAWAVVPSMDQLSVLDLLRYTGGVILILFNVWVKFDAHRVIGQFSWFWGDFFYLKEADLKFDGVFNLAPHPMYSVGYAGYYGISLISNSYFVLTISILAHAAQFLFLYVVEEPHIQKTYGTESFSWWKDPRYKDILYGTDVNHAYFRRDLIIFQNFDLLRSQDLFLAVAVGNHVLFCGPWASLFGINIPDWLIVGQAIFWRLVYSFGLGYVLKSQSKSKWFTKHFIKYGGTAREAFASWKSIFNFALTMQYTTFMIAAFKFHLAADSWSDMVGGTYLVRHLLGGCLIMLHLWMSMSSYEALGDFGWFYSDFFIDEVPPELHYTGIYRYLNNPEKILGMASYWGLALMSGSRWVISIAVVSHLANWWFLEYVEAPHMRKVYGVKIRQESGVSHTIRKQISKQKILSDVNKVIEDLNKAGTSLAQQVEKVVTDNLSKEVEKVMDLARPRIEELLSESRGIIADATSRIATVNQDVDAVDHSLFSLDLSSQSGSFPKYELGQEIVFNWVAPANQLTKNWIGIYNITKNPSKAVTTVNSMGYWAYADEGSVDGSICKGKTSFAKDRLPWQVGVYEARLHLNDKYIVAAVTPIFEIYLTPQPPLEDLFIYERRSSLSQDNLSPPLVQNSNSFEAIVSVLTPIYKRVLSNTSEQPFAQLHFQDKLHGTESHAQRIVYGIKQLYGIEFSWKVPAILEPTVERMAERIQEARVVLAPTEAEEWRSLGLNNQADYMKFLEEDRLRRGRKRTMSQKK